MNSQEESKESEEGIITKKWKSAHIQGKVRISKIENKIMREW